MPWVPHNRLAVQACRPASPAPDPLKRGTRLPQYPVPDPPSSIKGRTGAVLRKYPDGPEMLRCCSKTTLPRHLYRSSRLLICARTRQSRMPHPQSALRFLSPASTRGTGHWIDRLDKSQSTAGTLPALVARLGSSLSDLGQSRPSPRSARSQSQYQVTVATVPHPRAQVRVRVHCTVARQLGWMFMSRS